MVIVSSYSWMNSTMLFIAPSNYRNNKYRIVREKKGYEFCTGSPHR